MGGGYPACVCPRNILGCYVIGLHEGKSQDSLLRRFQRMIQIGASCARRKLIATSCPRETLPSIRLKEVKLQLRGVDIELGHTPLLPKVTFHLIVTTQ